MADTCTSCTAYMYLFSFIHCRLSKKSICSIGIGYNNVGLHIKLRTGWAKKHTKFMAIILSNLNDFQNSLSGRFPGKFEVN